MRNFLVSFAICIFTFSMAAKAETPKRVLSIAGANTEIVYALGAEDMLVGSDTTSYFPEAAAKLPKVGYMRALSAEGVLSLNPDLIILTEEAGPPAVIKQLEQAGAEMLLVKASRSMEDIKENVAVIGAALGKDQEAKVLMNKIDGDTKSLERAIADMKSKPSYIFIMQHGGGAPMVAGTKTSADSIITLAGGKNAVTGYEGYKPLTPEAAIEMAPDVILVTNRGLAQAGGLESFKSVPGVSLTEAAKNDRIIALDALFMLGFGPRTAEAALEILKLQKSM